MEIIKGIEGWYVCIDIEGVGFAESIWYPTEKDLATAVINNTLRWHSRHLTSS